MAWALMLCCVLGLSHSGHSQSLYAVKSGEDINVRLLGTSTLHDWEMEAKSVTGNAEFVFASGSQRELTALKALTFTLAVTDLQSDSKGLDKNAYKALKADAYAQIHYVLSSATLSPETGGYLVRSKGKLTIAGATRDIEMDVHLAVTESGTVTCKGAYALKMTDYEVTPPSFMMGVMKAGDDLTLEFTVVYQMSTGA